MVAESSINHENDNHESMNGKGDNHNSLRATVRESSIFGNNVKESQRNVDCTCKNCGYELTEEMKVCPACGTPVNKSEKKEIRGDAHKFLMKGICPKCGAELIPNARFCPQCGHTLRAGTVGVWENPQQDEFCTLKPIAWAREEIEYNPISYSGDIIVLNRENTEPNNQTITSKEQAVLTHENGAWYIEDHSEKKSTMLRITKKTKLESGDIIALGNRLFEFKA